VTTVACAGEWIPRELPAGTALPDPQSWWGEYGYPGWVADLWLDGESPAQVAGHARGGLRIDEPLRPPRSLADPGGTRSFIPLTFYDSLRVVQGVGSARQGFDGALTTLEGRTGGPGPRGADAVLDLRSGDFNWDENSLMVGRRDSTSWLRAEAYDLKRNPFGYYETAGRHMWDLAGGLTRKRHSVWGSFSQEARASSLRSTEEQSTEAHVGSASYRYDAPSGGGFELDYARARSRYESFADYFDQSIRSATNERFAGSMWHRSGFTGSLEYRKEHVLRSLSDEFDAHAHSLWGTFGWSGMLGAGRLDATLGAGTHQALDNKLYPAPSVSYEVQGSGFTARAGIERVLHAQWVDLVLDVNPFLQSTWAGVLDLNLGSTPQRHARLTYLAGRTRARIIINRTPLEEFALRTGAFPDPDLYGFGLFSAEGHTEWRALFFTGSAFVLSRPRSDAQSRVDPGSGGRAIVGTRFHLFQGDLAVQLWGGAEGVGARESEIAAERVLPAYATSSFGTTIRWGEVWITVRARNLENESHEEPWEDAESGLEALGPGRELRFALTAVLHN